MVWLTTNEAAARLDVGRARVAALCREGRLVHRRTFVEDRGIREAIVVDEKSVEEFSTNRKTGGWRERDSEEVQREMRERKYMTTTEAALVTGISANTLAKSARQGRIKSETRNVVWIPEQEVMRLKAEREAKLAAVTR